MMHIGVFADPFMTRKMHKANHSPGGQFGLQPLAC